MLTGVLCIVASGTQFQVVIAFAVCTVNAMLLLREAPYVIDSVDQLSITCAMSLSITLFVAFMAMADEGAENSIADPGTLDAFMVGVNTVPVVLLVVNVVRFAFRSGSRREKGRTKIKPQQRTAEAEARAAKSWES